MTLESGGSRGRWVNVRYVLTIVVILMLGFTALILIDQSRQLPSLQSRATTDDDGVSGGDVEVATALPVQDSDARASVVGSSASAAEVLRDRWRIIDATSGSVIDEFEILLGVDGDGGMPFAVVARGYQPSLGLRPKTPLHEVALRRSGVIRFEIDENLGPSQSADLGCETTIQLVKVSRGSHANSETRAASIAGEQSLVYVRSASNDQQRDGILRRMISEGSLVHGPLRKSGVLPFEFECVPPGEWTYRIVESSIELEPSAYRPFSSTTAGGIVRSEPALLSFAREPLPQVLGPGETIVFGLFTIPRASLIVDLPAFDSSDAYANVLVRHVDVLPGETRSDVESSVATRRTRVTFEGLRPGRKLVTATLRAGNVITWLEAPVESLEPGSLSYVELAEREPRRGEFSLTLRLEGEQLWGGATDAREAAEWKVTYIEPAGTGGLKSRRWTLQGAAPTLVLRGVRGRGSRLHVMPPLLSEGYALEEELPGKYSIESLCEGTTISQAVRAEIIFHSKETGPQDFGILLEGTAHVPAREVRAQVRSGVRGRTASARRLEAQNDSPLVVPLADDSTEVVCLLGVGSDPDAGASFFWANVEGLDRRGGVVPVSAVETADFILVVAGQVQRGDALSIGLSPSSTSRSYFLGLTAVLGEPDALGMRRSEPLRLPVDWFVEIAGQRGGRVKVERESKEINVSGE
jgi:hypothetical protein